MTLKRFQELLLPVILLLAFTGIAKAVDPSINTEEGTAAANSSSYIVSDVQWVQTGDDFVLRIKGESPPTYTMYELFDPLRINIDIADAVLSEAVDLPLDMQQGPVSQVKGEVLDDREPYIARIEIVLAEDRGYMVEREENDIVVKFAKDISDQSAVIAEAATVEEKPEEIVASSMQDTVPDALPEEKATALYGIDIESDADATKVHLRADGPVKSFKRARLPKGSGRPDRMYIDIPDIKTSGLPTQKTVGTSLARIRTARRGGGMRIVFDSGLESLFSYDIATLPDGLLVTIKESGTSGREEASPAEALIAGIMKKEEKHEETVAQKKETPISSPELIQPVIPKTVKKKKTTTNLQRVAAKPEPAGKEKKQSIAEDSFSAFSGYTKQRITVDFFKIDLHNVFRFFGEISEELEGKPLNIIITEGVKGTLTLALNDVPWDFALDVILNLKDLQKMERHNTLLIAPKSKNFAWPERTVDKIEFKAASDQLTIQKRIETPKEVIAAKKHVTQAQRMEKAKDYAAALQSYEEAYGKWPENGQLANRIAALCLVELGRNAKALHYAKAALAINPEDYTAALHAAIGLANMQKYLEAKEYFDLAISGEKPSGEALVSYAAFTEENESLNAALSLYDKHEEIYGDTLETMIAKARILDKIGNADQAVMEYRAALLSGFDIPADLERYIKGRIAMANQ